MPFFSVIMQSKLSDYPGAASNRVEKLHRAVASLSAQTFTDWELICVADNCHDTVREMRNYDSKQIVTIEHNHTLSGKWFSVARNVGIRNATGRYIVYLDSDDMFVSDYLNCLYREIQHDFLDWYVTDHLQLINGQWRPKRVQLIPNSAGTANVVHSKTAPAMWPNVGHYGSEDWRFIRTLMSHNLKHRHLYLAGYCICHIRDKYDV